MHSSDSFLQLLKAILVHLAFTNIIKDESLPWHEPVLQVSARFSERLTSGMRELGINSVQLTPSARFGIQIITELRWSSLLKNIQFFICNFFGDRFLLISVVCAFFKIHCLL